jgi:hypothetical protein
VNLIGNHLCISDCLCASQKEHNASNVLIPISICIRN